MHLCAFDAAVIFSRMVQCGYIVPSFLSCLVGSPLGRKTDESPLSTGALVGISIGVGVVVLVVLIICCVVYRRQKKQVDEYKEIYFLRQSDYKVHVFCKKICNLAYRKCMSVW